ncbi:hypothetical protein J437_LFUL010055 [Ladona fulva]|uniref:Uncharacterized protein n=1 Tax=Ladona fulva TaxID=123851 RepID=A0A8K0K882_LADFU|nr:hypothetical protein J437_LFUL010055 [Ladona fulva]
MGVQSKSQRGQPSYLLVGASQLFRLSEEFMRPWNEVVFSQYYYLFLRESHYMAVIALFEFPSDVVISCLLIWKFKAVCPGFWVGNIKVSKQLIFVWKSALK